MTQAIIAFSGDNVLTRQIPRSERVKIHWVLQAFAASCIAFSFFCIYTYKSNANKEHFTSTHGYMGFLTLLFCLGTVGGGTLAAYSVNFRHLVKPVIVKIIHSSFGVISYSMAIVTIFLGLSHPWTQERLSTIWINTLTAVVGFIWLFVVSRPVITICNRVTGLGRSN